MSMFEDVPVHGRRSDLRNSNIAAHQRNLSLDFRHVTGATGPPAGCGHQRNRSLDSVLQRIPEDMTPTSPEGAPLRLPIEVSAPRLALPPEVPVGSDDSGIHTPPDGNDEERPQPPAAARSRESLDSGNPEETEKPPDPPDDEGAVTGAVEQTSVVQDTVACNKKGFSFGSIRGKFFNKCSGHSEDKNKGSGHSSSKHVGEVEGKRSEIKCGSGRWWKDGTNVEEQFDKPKYQGSVDCCDSVSNYSICPSQLEDKPIIKPTSLSQTDEVVSFQSTDYCNTVPSTNLPDDTSVIKPSCSQSDETSEDTEEGTAPSTSKNATQSKSQDSKNSHDPIYSRLQNVDLSKKKDVLLRLFESKLFDMSMAISYLYNSKEPGVQSYLANKLFSFSSEDVDFYLPQLATMYIEMGDLAEVLKPYLVYRCKQSAEFSLRLAWLLTAFGGDARRSRATKLRDSVLAEEIRPMARRGHHRSQSDASALRLATPTGRYLGDLASGRAFDNGCLCGEQCSCGAPRLAPEIQFLTALTNIGRRLASVPDKERRKGRLRDELLQLDLNLPARVWLPLHPQPHYVLRIPPQAAAVLNSKDKAPYIMYVEVLETEEHSPPPPLPPRLLPPAPPAPHSPPIRHTKSEENLVPEWPALALYSGMDDVDASDCWSHDDEPGPFAPYAPLTPRCPAPDTLSQVSALSTSSCGSRESVVVGAGDVRRRLADATAAPPPNVFRIDPTDPSATALKESWESKLSRMRSTSPYGSLPGWKLLGCIVKVGDDLRQEMLAVQILRKLQSVWDLERVPLKLHPYEILCLDKECGLIQPVLNSVSLHQIKKQSGKSLLEWLQLEHGAATSEGFLRAQDNFVRSAAAYALTSYLLQLKDRHNGNILLDSAGHLVHIDFGFIFSTSPRNLGFETSPFKLTSEFVEVMGGEDSDLFAYFKILMLRGLIAARKHCDPIIHLVELMRGSGQLPCLRSHAVAAFRARFHHGRTDAQLHDLVERLVSRALRSLSTRLYDNYQYYTNGIL